MAGPQIKVIAYAGAEELGRYSLGPGEYTIGRSSACELQLKISGVSRQHARLVVNPDGGMSLEDVGSANGTSVDGEPVASRIEVRPNQTVQVGAVSLLVQQEVRPSEGLPKDTSGELSLPPEFHHRDRYQVGAEIAKGGMGAILAAQQVTIRRPVAMKRILGHTSRSPRQRLRFIEEAQITGQLEHPNIVPVYDLAADEDGQPYYTMKLVRGITLKKILELLKEGVPATVGKYQLPVLLTIFQKVCDAVAFAHSKGVIHRDLKPANIMVGYFGEVLVMDWGLAKLIGPANDTAEAINEFAHSARVDQGDAFSTLDGSVMGTPHYMAPEQARGEIEKLDPRTDIFALGAILYHILTLELPFTGRGVQEIVEKILTNDLIPPASRVARLAGGQKPESGTASPEVPRSESAAPSKKPATRKAGAPHLPGGRVPPSLDAVVMKALSHSRSQRYQHVKELQADLAAYQAGFATGAEKAGAWTQAILLLKRHRSVVSAAAAAFLLLIAVSTAFTVKVVRERDRAVEFQNNLSGSAPLYIAEAKALIEEEQFEAALAKITSAIRYRTEEAEYHALQGNVLQSLQRFPEAGQAYLSALLRDRGYPFARVNAELSDALSRQKATQPTLSIASTLKLHNAMMEQGRQAEAVTIRRSLQNERKILFELWSGVLASHGMQNFNEGDFVLDEDGRFVLSLVNRGLRDIAFLGGMPLKRLDLRHNGDLKDLSPLKGLQHLREFRVDATGVEDLSPLRGIPLEVLHTGGAKDWTPLIGMPLRELVVGDEKLTDISFVKGMPLKKIGFIPAHRLSDLRPLEGALLEEFRMHITSVSDLTPLTGMRLKHFAANRAAVADLEPLRGHPIETAELIGIPLTDFTVISTWPLTSLTIDEKAFSDTKLLSGKALTNLNLEHSGVTDISPLRGMPLETLLLAETKVTDFRPLTEMPRLKAITLPKEAVEIEFLRQLPKIEQINKKPAAEFWKEFEATGGARN